MKVSDIDNNYKQSVFQGFERSVYKAGKSAIEENLLHRNNTWFLRSDINWYDLAQNIKHKFPNLSDVQFYVYACSDGREAHSLLMALYEVYSAEEIEKMKPIIAKDYDLFAINKAKANFYEISEEEERRIKKLVGTKFNKYFQTVSKLENRYKVTDILTSKIIYEQGDFTKEYSQLPKENVFLSVRNCWPYFSMQNQYNLPKKVCKHFDKNTMIVIGSFDLNTQESIDFTENGFKILPSQLKACIFEK